MKCDLWFTTADKGDSIKMKWTQGLNPEQQKAVLHNEGPLLILAGAGSGKTTVLVARTGRLIDEGLAPANQICVLTFTNKAARELKERVAHKVGDIAKGLWAGTFHSFGLRLLREFHTEAGLPKQFGVIDQSDSTGILRELLKDNRVVGKDKFDLEKILTLVNHQRVHGRQRLEGQDEYHEIAEMLFPKFVRRLELLGVVDFEGLLLKPLQLFKDHPAVLAKVRHRFRYMMVDEFQDTNDLQMRLVELLVKEHRNIAVVGDDDQSIYGWRGAMISNILDFPKHFPPCVVIRLERNYRSAPEIVNLANEVIEKNKKRHGKILRAEGKFSNSQLPELFLIDNEEDESEFVSREIQTFIKDGFAAKDIAVLYRSNSQGGMIESTLRGSHIPYSVSGGTAFFDRREVKDAMAYLRSALAPNDVAFKRIVNTPARGIGDTSLEKLNAYALANKCSFFKACHHWQEAGIQEKAGEALTALLANLQKLPQRLLSGAGTPGERLSLFFREIGYRDYLFLTSSQPLAGEKKWNLVEILGRILSSYSAKAGLEASMLRDFLDAMELRDDVEDDEKKKGVSLMTLHACKGLEFPVVILVGVEEDLLPHRTLGSDVDEERRLFYVGITRAKERLILTRCRTRKRHGQIKPVTMSRFLLELSGQNIKDHRGEFRPVSSEQRENLLSSFLSGLDQKLQGQPKK